MPTRDFFIVPKEGLETNGRVDLRNKKEKYVCFMKHDVKQLHFFDYFSNNVNYPIVVAI